MISEHDPRFNAMTASIKEEVEILREGLGKIREEIIEGSVNISQQAVQLQNLLSASKTGLLSFKGRTDSNFCHSSVCFYPSLLLLLFFVCFAIRPMY